MKSTQNKKIQQVKETTLVVEIDVGSQKHYFRAFNWRGIELTKKLIPFSNSMVGFNAFYEEVTRIMEQNDLEETMVGFESTGHCKCQYKIVGFLSYKNVGKPTRLYDILCNLIFLNHILHLIL